MGAVYEVLQLNIDRRRALKVMHAHKLNDPGLRERFDREAQLIARVRSDHIVEIIDSGVDEPSGAPYIVMELLQGVDLATYAARRGRLKADEVVNFAWQAAIGLDKLHEAGIIHRDIKPGNLFVSRRDTGEQHIHLIDLGIAKSIGPSKGRATTGLLGTPSYAAPEQIHAEVPVSAATDRYALAHLVYALLAGEPYWAQEREDNTDVYPLLMTIVQGPPEAPSERAARRNPDFDTGLAPKFDAWFERAAAVAADERYVSMQDMLQDLAEALSIEHDGIAAGAGLGPCADSGPPPTPRTIPPPPVTRKHTDELTRRAQVEPVSANLVLPSAWPRPVVVTAAMTMLLMVVFAGLWAMQSNGAEPIATATRLPATEYAATPGFATVDIVTTPMAADPSVARRPAQRGETSAPEATRSVTRKAIRKSARKTTGEAKRKPSPAPLTERAVPKPAPATPVPPKLQLPVDFR